MARIVAGPEITGRVVQTQTGSPLAGVTVTVSKTVYTDIDMTQATTTLTTNGTGDWSCYAAPGNYTFTTTAAGAAPIEPVKVQGIEEGTGTPLNATYQPINGAALTNPSGLRRWFDALGDAMFSTANIACVGDSITIGAYSNNAGTFLAADESIFAVRGYAGQLRQLFANVYGDLGEGIIQPGDKRVTYAGGATSGDITLSLGAQGTVIQDGTSRTVTYSLPACTAFDILLWTDYGATSSVPFTVDGGATQNTVASPTGTQNVAYKHSVTGLANTTHTVVIGPQPTGSGITTVYPYGIVAKTSATAGVRVHRLGTNGATSTVVLNIGASAGGKPGTMPDRSYMNALGPNGANANLVILPIGTNDAAAQNPNPTTYLSNLQTFITYVTGTLNACVLLVGEPRRQSPAAGFTEQNYYDQMAALAASNQHVAYLDVLNLFGTYAQATAADAALMQDGIHPNRKGHGLIARALFSILTTPVRYPGT